MTTKKRQPSLQFATERLVARMLRRSDYDCWVEAHRLCLPKQNPFDLIARPRAEVNYPSFLNMLARHHQQTRAGAIYSFYAFDRQTGALIGTTQCAFVQRFNAQRAVLGYSVFNNYWRRGYGFEMAHGMIHHAFRRMRLHRLEAEIDPHNKPSIRLARKLGMKREGIRRGALYILGRWCDQLVYSITAEDVGVHMRPNRTFI